MNPLARVLVFAGLLLVAAGLALHFAGRHVPFGRLPGDIVFGRGSFRLYLPIGTSIVISVVLSALLALFRLFR